MKKFKLFFYATMTIVAFGASQSLAQELDTSIAERGGHGGGGEFHGGGGGEFRGGGDRHDHDNWNGDHRVIEYNSGFVSPYNSTEYYYDDPDLPDAVDVPPEDYYEQSTFENN